MDIHLKIRLVIYNREINQIRLVNYNREIHQRNQACKLQQGYL